MSLDIEGVVKFMAWCFVLEQRTGLEGFKEDFFAWHAKFRLGYLVQNFQLQDVKFNGRIITIIDIFRRSCISAGLIPDGCQAWS